MAAPVIVAGGTAQNLFGGAAPAASYNLTIQATGALPRQLVLISSIYEGASSPSAWMQISSAQTNNANAFVKDAGPTLAGSPGTAPLIGLEIWRCAAPTAGSVSVTVNYTNSGLAGTQLFGSFTVLEITGMAASPIDGGYQSSIVASTQTLSVTTTSGQGDILFYAWSSVTGTSPGAPWVDVGTTGDLVFKQSVATNATTSGATSGGTDPYVAGLIAYAGLAAGGNAWAPPYHLSGLRPEPLEDEEVWGTAFTNMAAIRGTPPVLLGWYPKKFLSHVVEEPYVPARRSNIAQLKYVPSVPGQRLGTRLLLFGVGR